MRHQTRKSPYEHAVGVHATLVSAAVSTYTIAAGLVVVLPSWLPYAAVAVSGLAGATYGAKRGFDVVGVCGLAFATGLGGLILRDLLISSQTPNIFTEPLFVIVAFWTAVVGFFFAGLISRFESIMVVLDGLAMGLLCALGAGAALVAGLPASSAVFVGVITAVGGPFLRDVLAGTAPSIVRPGVFIAVPAIIASTVFVFMVELNLSPGLAQIAAMIVSLILRASAQWFGLKTGSAAELSDRVWNFWQRDKRDTPEMSVEQTQQHFTDFERAHTQPIERVPPSDSPTAS